MSTKDKIKEYILNNPDLSNKEVAAVFDTTPITVSGYRMELRENGKLPPLEKGWNRKPVVEKPPKEEFQHEDDGLVLKIKEFFKKKDVRTLVELSDYFDIGISKIRKVIEIMIGQGHNFKIENDYVIASKIIEQSEATTLPIKKPASGFYRFGATGDQHLGSRYERLDALNTLYDRYEQEGITTVYNTGNWIDGEARFNKHDLIVHGMDRQIDYFLKNYPKREGITTYLITGDDHEGWYTQREGINIGKYMQMKAEEHGRTDLKFIGHMEADIILPAERGETKLRVLHPGGGSSYAVSYSVQKIIESYQGGEKPDVLLVGHYHKAEYNFCRGVHAVQTGCMQDQTPFMRKKKIAAHLGGWIIEFSTDEQGAITRFKQEFIPFYDNGYYKDKWSYKW